MTIARHRQICLETTPYYHCTNRCVRRAYLCGDDPLTHRNYDHRRYWIDELLLTLTNAFCIDITAYSVKSNHYHVVVKIDSDRVNTLNDFEIIDRWCQIYTVPATANYYKKGYTLTESQGQKLNADILHWRSQLTSLSRFMGYFNEKIARRANHEDHCTGRFWQSRFASHAVVDVKTLLQSLDMKPTRDIAAQNTGQHAIRNIQKILNAESG